MHSHVIKLYIMDIYNFKTKKKKTLYFTLMLCMTNIYYSYYRILVSNVPVSINNHATLSAVNNSFNSYLPINLYAIIKGSKTHHYQQRYNLKH